MKTRSRTFVCGMRGRCCRPINRPRRYASTTSSIMSAVDRYHLADGYHQVMLATRELSPELPAQAQTWVNQYLQFTHGYGLVMNFVSKKVGGGFPEIPSRERPCRIRLRPEHNPACDLLRRVNAGLSDRGDRHQGVRLPQGKRQCLHQLQRERGYPAGQLLEEAPVRLDPEGRQHSVDLLPQAGKPHPDLADGSGARGTDRAVLAPRQRSLPRAERGQAVLDPGCLHGLRPISVCKSSRGRLR